MIRILLSTSLFTTQQCSQLGFDLSKMKTRTGLVDFRLTPSVRYYLWRARTRGRESAVRAISWLYYHSSTASVTVPLPGYTIRLYIALLCRSTEVRSPYHHLALPLHFIDTRIVFVEFRTCWRYKQCDFDWTRRKWCKERNFNPERTVCSLKRS